jgi:hypothetical protein
MTASLSAFHIASPASQFFSVKIDVDKYVELWFLLIRRVDYGTVTGIDRNHVTGTHRRIDEYVLALSRSSQ